MVVVVVSDEKRREERVSVRHEGKPAQHHQPSQTRFAARINTSMLASLL